MSNYPYEISTIDDQHKAEDPIWRAVHLSPILESVREQAREYASAFKEMGEKDVYTKESASIMERVRKNRVICNNL